MTPQLVRSCEVVRGVHIEEQELGVRQTAHLFQREDTDPDAVVEADSAKTLIKECDGQAAVVCPKQVKEALPTKVRETVLMKASQHKAQK